jgi:flagellar biosynthesis regulator FlaF
VRFFFAVWDPQPGRDRVIALLASAMTNEAAARMIREFLTREVFERLVGDLGADRTRLRASLTASQMFGLVVARYVVKLEPLASMPAEDLVPMIGPTLQRYLTGELPD